MKITCSRRFYFCAGHRLMNHESYCVNLHGHNYMAEIYASAEKLDHLGRVIDFGILKEKVGGWIKRYWDHGFIRAEEDEVAKAAIAAADSKHFVLPYNPTSENLARYLLTEVCPNVLDGTDVVVDRIVLWETEDCFAECRLD